MVGFMETNILVLDDEREIADLVELYLKAENFRVFKFYNSADALRCLSEQKIDLAVLDVMLPDISGFELCALIRESHTFPILMLSARVGDIDKITGLTVGADDYITKPFHPAELIARVKAQLRRVTKYDNTSPPDENILDFSGLVIKKDTHECSLYGKTLDLTPIEFSILWMLCENRGKVMSAEEIYQNVWHEEYLDSNNTIMVHIRRLREKMNDSAKKPKFIKTVWGVGYKIDS